MLHLLLTLLELIARKQKTSFSSFSSRGTLGILLAVYENHPEPAKDQDDKISIIIEKD